MSPEEFNVRKPIVREAELAFKTSMMTYIALDDDEHLVEAELERRRTIWNYELSIAEAAAFNTAIGYNPPIN